MPDSFFVSDKKRKRPARAGPSTGRPSRGTGSNTRSGSTSRPKQNSRSQRDEDVSSESEAGGGDVDDMDFRAGRGEVAQSDDELIDQNETAAEKRVRLAKGYLNKVREEMEAARDEEDYDAADIDRELIASRLQKDVAETQGRIHTFLASQVGSSKSRFISTPSHLPTSIALTPFALFVATKRGTIFRYALPSFKKIGVPFGQAHIKGPKTAGNQAGHRGEILCLAASEDGKWLVSGGRDKVVGVWDVQGDEAKWITGMRGHKDAISSISLPPLDNPSHHILTASLSRHLALASLSTLSVIDTFFGHQDAITAVDAMKPTSAVTAGSRDRTCRWWKVEEEVQLVFRGGGRTFEGFKGIAPDPRKERLGGGLEEEKAEDAEKRREVERIKQKGKGREFVEGSIDCVCMLDDQYFVSGGDSGSISLWHTGKKKPIFTQPLAHGVDDLTVESETKGARWITSLATLRGTDLFASGSWDGEIRLWAVDRNMRSFKPAGLHTVSIPGFINSLQMLSLPSQSVDEAGFSAPNDATDILGDINLNSTTSSQDRVDAEVEAEESTKKKTSKQSILLVAAVGQEPRLGRWMRIKDDVKNGALAVVLNLEA